MLVINQQARNGQLNHTQLTHAMRIWNFPSIYRQSILDGICEQTMMNFKNMEHGFCAEGSHLADTRVVFVNSSWLESSTDFLDREEGRFWDGRFSNMANTQSNSCLGPGNYILHALFGPVLFLLLFNSLSIACSYFGMFDGHGEYGMQCLQFIKSR